MKSVTIVLPVIIGLMSCSCVNRAGQIRVSNPGLPFVKASSISTEVPTSETPGTHSCDEHDRID